MWKIAPVFYEGSGRQPGTPLNSRQGSNPTLYDSRGTPYPCPQTQSQQQQQQNDNTGLNSSPLTQCIWTFFWLGVLLAVAYPIGFFACLLYVLFQPIGVLCPMFAGCSNVLLKISQFPLMCTKNMANAKALISM